MPYPGLCEWQGASQASIIVAARITTGQRFPKFLPVMIRARGEGVG